MSCPDSSHSPDSHACGACRVCCTNLAIPAGDVGPGLKPAGVPCPNITPAGCRIYGRRPKTCVDFSCAWLDDSAWPERWRPDRSQLFCLRAEIESGVPAAAVYELKPGALQSSVAAELLTELKRTTKVIALVNVQNKREKLTGNWVAGPPEPAVPAPHFIGRAKKTPRNRAERLRFE